MKENNQIKVTVSGGALSQEITIQKWAINCNTKQWLIDMVIGYINAVLEDKEVE